MEPSEKLGLVPGLLRRSPVLPVKERPAVQAKISTVQIYSVCCTVLDSRRYVSNSTGRNGMIFITLVHSVRRQASAGPSGAAPSITDASSSEAIGSSLFQTILDRLNQL